MIRIAFVLSCLLISLVVRAESNHCEIYLDLEEKKHCSQNVEDYSGYLINVGYSYCRQFTAAAKNWDSELRQFIKLSASCLQKKIIEVFALGYSCKQAEDLAFASHTVCYVESGFCELGISQKARVLRRATRLDLLFKLKQSAGLSLELMRFCSMTRSQSLNSF